MADEAQLDRAYDAILRVFIERGSAPHFTELARTLDLSADEAKRLVHDLFDVAIPIWLYPRSDLVASFAPFNNLPTQYRISVDGEEGWYAQCGLESLAVSWLFPGSDVRVDAPCLDCAEPLSVVVRDGRVLGADPADVCFFVDVPVRDWQNDIPFA